MLATSKIAELSRRKNVKSVAVENFLSSLDGLSYTEAIGNLEIDGRLYKWNAATYAAIKEGIILTYKK